jgi:hypothetical protein
VAQIFFGFLNYAYFPKRSIFATVKLGEDIMRWFVLGCLAYLGTGILGAVEQPFCVQNLGMRPGSYGVILAVLEWVPSLEIFGCDGAIAEPKTSSVYRWSTGPAWGPPSIQNHDSLSAEVRKEVSEFDTAGQVVPPQRR